MKSVFARKLCHLRHEAGCSQRQAASDLGVSQALLSHYENGAREPKLEFVVKVCDYYKVSADHLLGRVEEKMKSVLPMPSDEASAARLIAAASDAFETLDGLSDKEVYSAAMDYLTMPLEMVAKYIHEPETEYDPMRDARQKMAEARFKVLVKGLRNGRG